MKIIYVDKVVIKKKYYYDDKFAIFTIFDVEDIKGDIIGWILIHNNHYSFSPKQSTNYYVFSSNALQTIVNFINQKQGDIK